MVAKFSVKKPYTVLVAVVLVIVLGVVAIMKMTTDLLPDMSLQYALIITTDVGASPEEVESDVTAPVEASMATTSNIKEINSISYNSYSIVICEYAQNANMDSVVIEIQQELEQLKSGWDDSVGSPVIMQINPDMLPIVMAAVDMDGMDQSEIADYVNNDLIPSLESIEGVASVTATGAVEESIMVTLNQDKIDALNEKITAEINSQFEDAQEEIDSGKSQVESGQSAISSAGSQLSSAYSQVTSQKSTLSSTKTQLKAQLSELEEQKESLETVQSGINTFVNSTSYTMLAAMDKIIEYLDSEIVVLQNSEVQTVDVTQLISKMQEAGIDTSLIEESLNALQSSIDSAAEETQDAVTGVGIDALQSIRDTVAAKLEESNAQIASQFSGMDAMGVSVKTYKDLADAAGTVSTYVAQINTGIATIESALDQLDSGEDALNSAVDMINQNAALAAIQVAPSSAQLAVAASSLEQAQSTLDSSKESALEQADMNNVLSIETLTGLLTAQNFAMPAGYVNDGDTQYLVHVGDKITSIDDLKDLVLLDLGMDSVGVIHLSDVADVELKNNADDNYAVINGNPGIILSLEKQTGYSTGDVTDTVLEKFDTLEEENPGLHLTTLMNQGVYIDMVVNSVVQNMIVGAILAVLVLILFLKDIKPTIIIACSIPLSVVFAIVLMYFTGITLNIISLSGLVLGIGMLVDNSIVAIENIYRLRSEGYSVKKAAVEGTSQITGAIIASTLTTISVYAPIIFTEGITRQLFVDLSLTVAFTLTASLLVAMTLVPAMASVMLKSTKEIRHPWFEKFQNAYGHVLEKCLHGKVFVMIGSVVVLVVSGLLSYSRGLTFMDMDMDTGTISLTLAPKEDETLEFSELTALSDEVIGRISDIEGIDTIGATAGGSSTMSLMSGGSDSVSMYILLDEDSGVSSDEICQEIADLTADMDCDITTTTSSMDYSSYFGSGLTIEVKGPSLDKLQELTRQVADIVSATEGCIDVDDGLDNQTPQYSITVDKEKAAHYGMTVAQIFQLVYAKMADSTSATTISTDIKDYKVYLQTPDQAEATLDDIKNLTFTYTDQDGDEEEIKLSDVADMEETTTLSTISRTSQTRYLSVTCSIDDDHNVTKVSDVVQKKLDQLDVPEGYSVTMTGEDETIRDAMKQLLLMLVLAVIFIYLIMVAQFQSLLSPFIIMFTIPLAFTGGFIALFATGTEIGVLSMLGFIMLAGVIVNNGIVLIDYINQRRREGASKHDAIVEAGRTRLRPILMTALTTILAMIPTSLGMGDGSSMIQPMAITIVGGLVYGTLLTLIVIPCVYDIFNREKDLTEEEL